MPVILVLVKLRQEDHTFKIIGLGYLVRFCPPPAPPPKKSSGYVYASRTFIHKIYQTLLPPFCAVDC